LCKHVICKYGGRCESGECICPTSCHTTREPVCASNAVTYLNECEMDKASCRMGRGALRVVFFGECAEARSSGITGGDPCTIMSCEFGSTCVVMADGLPRCTCTLDCTEAIKDPVCASDLKMYPNECTMNREACQRQVELRLRPLELCE
ncbi:Tomoregulin-2, partial [Armadillidium nasatum]